MAGENTPIPEARTIHLGTRADGDTTGDKAAILRPGELLRFGVEAVKIAGTWLYSADNVTEVDVGVPTGVLVATYVDVRDSIILIDIDATNADDTDQWLVRLDIHPTAAQTIKGEIEVRCEDD